MRILALDPGERWVGVAISDGDQRLALPLTTLDRRTDPGEGVERLRRLLADEPVTLIVVGVPVNPFGEEDAQAAAFRAYGERVAAALGLPVALQDERYSNPISEVPRPPAPRRRQRAPSVADHRRRRMDRHAAAAAAILQRYLDSRRRTPDAVPAVPESTDGGA